MKPTAAVRSSALAAALALTSVIHATPAASGDVQGDAYGCGELWQMRNQVFKEAGYCFQTPRAIATFGNKGCAHENVNDVPLSTDARALLGGIRRSERRQSC